MTESKNSERIDFSMNDEERLSSSDLSEDCSEDSATKIPKGAPKSGRFWKTEKSRARSIVKTRGLKFSVEKKLKLKKDLSYIKSLSRQIIENKNKEKENRRLRRIENLKRREENQKKSEVVQVIKNPQKIKRMKKKQLRTIEKRDTLVLQK
ncbi:coiled-coil domain-containing protein 86 [Lycorma delicatula]|uniref:coiled-coil domain-containing protein 86 n=1 Tax=Lycorma delicatula TaxID=130591 RepID=UPI003F50D9A3